MYMESVKLWTAILLMSSNAISRLEAGLDYCYAPATCWNDNNGTTNEWIQIDPFKPCEKSKLEGNLDGLVRASASTLQNLVTEFLKDIEGIGNNSYVIAERNSDSPLPGTSECHAAVVCDSDHGSSVAWEPIVAYNCTSKEKLNLTFVMDFYNQAIDRSVEGVRSYFGKTCGSVTVDALGKVVVELENSKLNKSSITEKPKQCYISSFCDDGTGPYFAWTALKSAAHDCAQNYLKNRVENTLKSLLDETLKLAVSEFGASCTTPQTTAASTPVYSDDYCFLGMKSRAIPDSAITVSSAWNSTFGGRYGRLDENATNKDVYKDGDSYGCWHAKSLSGTQWIQVDLEAVKSVSGIITQGRPQSYVTQYVKTYKITCGEHVGNLTAIKEDGVDKVFKGNTDQYSKVRNLFPTPTNCRYVRVIPETWNNFIAMRIELLKGDCFQYYKKLS